MIWYESVCNTIQTNNIPKFLLIIQYYAEEYKCLSPLCTILMSDHLALLEAALSQFSLECPLVGPWLMGFSTCLISLGACEGKSSLICCLALANHCTRIVIMQMEGPVHRTVYLMGDVNIFYFWKSFWMVCFTFHISTASSFFTHEEFTRVQNVHDHLILFVKCFTV